MFLIPLVVLASSALVAAGLFPVVAGAGRAVKQFNGQFLPQGDETVQIGAFPLRSTIYAADGTRLATVADYNRTEVKLADVPRITRDAVLAIEDHDFYKHGPVDPTAILRAIVQNLTAGQVVSGASTISQQLIKNTLVGTEETLKRKIEEAKAAITLERTYTKDQILEAYLNEIYLGHGTYGIGAAAEWYFAKNVKDLTLPESALLAGLISAPEYWDPVDKPDLAQRRRDQVLRAMLKYGFINDAQLQEAVGSDVKLRSKTGKKDNRNVNEPGDQPYFVRFVEDEILHPTKGAPWYKEFLKIFGKTYAERQKSLFQGGLRIYTTLRPDMQQEAADAVAGRIPNPGFRPPTRNPEAALVSLVPQTGAIEAMFGGPDFEKHKINLAVQGQRNAGSSFKAFTLAAAFEAGFPVGKVYDTPNPVAVDPSKCPDPSGQWKPTNAEPGGGGFMDMTTATASSVNVYFAQLIGDVGPSNVAEVAKKMGVVSYASNSKVNIPAVCAITLGSVEVNPLSMAAGYATLANEGSHCYPYAIRRIVSPAGKALFKSKPSCKRAIGKGSAAQVTGLLRGVLTHGTAANSNIPRPAAGKTGTAQNFTDAWFVGYVPQLVTAVWSGYGYPKSDVPMVGAPVLHGLHPYGGTLAAPIWHDFMIRALQGVPVQEFPIPPAPKAGKVPDVVGMKQDEAEKTLADANFTPIVKEAASTEPAGVVFEQSPAGGATATLGSAVTIMVSNGKAPKATVPDVVGQKRAAAKAALEAAGFVVDIQEQTVDDPALDGVVLEQQPKGGTKSTEGSTVTIIVGKFEPNPTPSPSP